MKILLILIAVSLFSCNSAGVNSGDNGLLTLSKGNSWSYDYDVELNPKSSSFKIESVSNSSGETKAVFDSFPVLGMWDTKTTILEKSDGSYYLDYPEAMDLMFIPPKEKIKTGYKWTSGEWNCNVAGESEDLLVSGKTYKNCVHISFSASITFWGEFWVKEGVGIVKWQFLRTNPPTTELGHYLLKEYSLK